MSYYNMMWTGKGKGKDMVFEVECPDEWEGKKEMTYKEIRKWRYYKGITH